MRESDQPIHERQEEVVGDGYYLPLTIGLLITAALLNFYVYTVGDYSASPLTVTLIVSHAYYVVVLLSAFMAPPTHVWTVWVTTTVSSGIYALVHSDEPGLIMAGTVFAVASAITTVAVRRLRVSRAAYERDLVALDAANADVQKRLEEQSALFEVSQNTATTFDLERLYNGIMATVSNRLKMYRGTLSLFDPETQELRVKYAYGLSQREIERGRYRLGEGLYGAVMASGEPMAVPNVGEQPIRLNATDALAFEWETRSVAYLCVPIIMEGRTAGVLSADRAPVDQRTLGDDLRFLTILASIFAQALKIQEMIEATVEHERMAALGRMAQSVAHEVRNPLGGIRGAAQLLQMSLVPIEASADGQSVAASVSDELREEAESYTDIIVQEVDRLNRVVEQLLHFGSSRTARREQHRLHEMIEHVVFLVGADAAARGVRVEQELPRELPHVEVDGDQMTQVFLNLVRNALEAMPDGGLLRVIARASEDESRGASSTGTVRVVEVEVADTGLGIAPHLWESIFDPLYTTKQKGTGIGLALTKRLVEEHDGYIEVSANEPRGARFTVVLPAFSG
ncbi:MAG: ATP-binding protein [Candidatus Poribacteria bacterium]|nr:ATP-binding protein [Candidatus Poribacteria bacterium]